MSLVLFTLWIVGHGAATSEGAEPALRVFCRPVGSWMADATKPYCEELGKRGADKGTLVLVETETEAEATVQFDGYGVVVPRMDSTSAACTVSAGKERKEFRVSRDHAPRPQDMDPVYEGLRQDLARKAEAWLWKQRKKIRP